MVIGAFAPAVYGSTRTTYDIDIIVDLDEKHIRALADTYPSPHYYADPVQMHDSIRMGIMFNIIDTSRGEKADLIPQTMDTRYRQAFQCRLRQMVELPGGESFEIWCARPEDVIVGKLIAWNEGRSRKHETDIYHMMVFYYPGADAEQSTPLNEAYVDAQARTLGDDVINLWEAIKDAARRAADRS
jgi:hypothetical protein